ncbi:MAG: hypothetical protein H6587_09815 [Flavobacteriales bacterium]|nr:hypothetical protein [Flavobacteriales bacterium]
MYKRLKPIIIKITTQILQLILIIIFISSCKKEEKTPAPTPVQTTTPTTNNLVFEDNIIGVWNIGSHEYNSNGGAYYNTGNTGTMTFLSNGTYTHSDFTYAWHCVMGANSADSGTWSYDSANSKLT